MKRLIKGIAASLGYKIEKINNPNPLLPKFQQLLKEHYGCYVDLKFTNLPTLDDQLLELFIQLDGTQVSEAIYILNSLDEVKYLEGDVCEFGVAQGYTSTLLSYSILKSTRNLWLFDSFKGLPAPTEKDRLKNDIFNLKKIEAYEGTMKHSVESVLHNLKRTNFPKNRTHIIDGFIEQTVDAVEMPSQVAFAFVDFDFYQPIFTALKFLDKVLVKNGIIIVDDYDFFSEGAKIAVDEFYKAHQGIYLMELPISSAGHFVILKRQK